METRLWRAMAACKSLLCGADAVLDRTVKSKEPHHPALPVPSGASPPVTTMTVGSLDRGVDPSASWSSDRDRSAPGALLSMGMRCFALGEENTGTREPNLPAPA